MVCPHCGTECWRDSADVGVGTIYGPWGCPGCGWSESPKYDLRDRPAETLEGTIDQYGGLKPKDKKEALSGP